MEEGSTIPVFGQKLPGQVYIPRPGAYAVILDTTRRIAALRVETGYFLPGGGSLPGEAPEATLRREVLEECGWVVEVGRRLGEAIEYIYAQSDGVYYEITSTFFTATFLDGQEEPLEKDHELVWLVAEEAAERLQRPGQAWAVRQYN